MQEIRCDLCGANHHIVVYRSEQKVLSAETTAYRISEGQLIAPEKILKCVNCGLIFVPVGDNSQKIINQYKEMVDEG
jgi:hypothetical protein